MSNDQTQWPWPIKPEDLYHILIDTRNLEVNLFWQRTNYFLALNSGIVLAFFNVKDAIYVRTFAIIGLLSSLLWFWACLASKYWQTFWAQCLKKFEEDKLSIEINLSRKGWNMKESDQCLVAYTDSPSDVGLSLCRCSCSPWCL